MAKQDKTAGIERYSRPGVDVVAVRGSRVTEYFLTVSPAGDDTESMFPAAAEALRETGAAVVSQEVFGISNEGGAGTRMLTDSFGAATWPVTWIEEGSEEESACAAIQIWAVSGADVTPVELRGEVVGSVFEDGHARYCRLGGLAPEEKRVSNMLQARAVIDLMEEGLQAAGMNFGNAIRTWFYNYRMLDWYDDFNVVRTQFFTERGVFDGLVPASTCVGARNGAGSALMAECLAYVPLGEGVEAKAVTSPLQCPAPAYGSSFSRAVELSTPELRRLYVSGTASISQDGRSVHVGDVARQVERTIEVAEAILKSCGMGWGDVSRAIGYYKRSADCPPLGAPPFGGYCKGLELPGFPVALIKNDICRDDLLFEIELDAIKPR
jgi:enamine deaminase RidA (YjgF/YER057c/UK114 family)